MTRKLIFEEIIGDLVNKGLILSPVVGLTSNFSTIVSDALRPEHSAIET